MLKKVFASAVFGVEASTITVDLNVDKGVGYHLLGLLLRFKIMVTKSLEKR